MSERPWISGPWHFHEHETHTGNLRCAIFSDDEMLIHDYVELSPTDGNGWIDPEIPVTVELIALAPEMAEAILEWDSSHNVIDEVKSYAKTIVTLRDLAARLRRIGSNDA